MIPVITIDGPVSSGKGTVARRVAARLGWHLLDSGALYRVLGLHAERRGVPLDDEMRLVDLAEQLPVEFREGAGDTAVILDGEDVGEIIREERVGELASQVAVLQPVRDALFARQRAFAQRPGLVADGRDMGTVVFRDAPLKVFLTASAEERARRRYAQLKEKGFGANLATLIEDIRTRDERDMQRAVAPLKPAPDAVEIDSTELNVEQVVDRILDEAGARSLT
ncbi:(d)CMP kinase [Alloalcanivorax profundimaris]|uniref:(d)CMP kinase n=1 Tax=Alloalcanivorax profundimaris TaxID=2735259 RepID=UPI0013693E0E|nr:(d)CMP kinase [Alloalcanivorax profundimaris]MBF1800162.1 (d)CMP kinase [Alloalcanivorax profundimaris]MBM1144850.1 (d)CMP kinase [Alcanivorax sp. ZXX171]MCQ6261907.1 (d)CMP kinase [Alcanivorax sp. MM125-6]QJX01526.1 (d)CMP kinase [Alcanivorax sp. IO_7]